MDIYHPYVYVHIHLYVVKGVVHMLASYVHQTHGLHRASKQEDIYISILLIQVFEVFHELHKFSIFAILFLKISEFCE